MALTNQSQSDAKFVMEEEKKKKKEKKEWLQFKAGMTISNISNPQEDGKHEQTIFFNQNVM